MMRKTDQGEDFEFLVKKGAKTVHQKICVKK